MRTAKSKTVKIKSPVFLMRAVCLPGCKDILLIQKVLYYSWFCTKNQQAKSPLPDLRREYSIFCRKVKKILKFNKLWDLTGQAPTSLGS